MKVNRKMRHLMFTVFFSLIFIAMLPTGGMAQSLQADFNGDGFEDLAVGVPEEDIGSITNAGAVTIIYGKAIDGLSPEGNQFFSLNTPGVPGEAESCDKFGSSLASGDFNGDGYSDLAIGIPNKDVYSINDAGAICVLYGSADGLTTIGAIFHQNYSGINDQAEENDGFGYALEAGDFNRDGYMDLAVGVPGEDFGNTIIDAGSVNILYGYPIFGLLAINAQVWSQNSSGIQGVSQDDDWFGFALAVGDFNADTTDDLAIGVPEEDIGSEEDAGCVNIIFGLAGTGLTSSGDQLWSQNSDGIPGESESGDLFGYALAAADFDNNGHSDLAIGVPKEILNNIEQGCVNTIYGRYNTGLYKSRAGFWSQDSTNIPGTPEDGDRFGHSLAAGDFDRDGYADLAIGIPYKDKNNLDNWYYGEDKYAYGTVIIMYSNEKYGVSNYKPRIPKAIDYQPSPIPVPAVPYGSFYPLFGWSLSALDFNGDSICDLAIGIPGQAYLYQGFKHNAGKLQVFYGDYQGLWGGMQTWGQYNPYWSNMMFADSDEAEAGDSFGWAF